LLRQALQVGGPALQAVRRPLTLFGRGLALELGVDAAALVDRLPCCGAGAATGGVRLRASQPSQACSAWAWLAPWLCRRRGVSSASWWRRCCSATRMRGSNGAPCSISRRLWRWPG
jgi:hypothetical protein